MADHIPHGDPRREQNLAKFLEGNHPSIPTEVFHSSKTDVKKFDPKMKGKLSPFGFHFGTADQANFRTSQYDFESPMPNVGKYHLSMKNPLEVSHMASFAPDHLADHMMDMEILDPDDYDRLNEKHDYEPIPVGNALVKILKKNGYDGLMYQNEREGEGYSFVPFDANQIKSATGNNGNFDTSEEDITKSEGGDVEKKGSLRQPALWGSAQKIKAGEGSRESHAALVNEVKPVRPYAEPVLPASDEEVHDALSKDKKPNAFAPRQLKDGTPVAVRLDIPAYEQKNTWVVSVHHPKSDFTAGPVIGYDSVAHITNPRFGVHPGGALNIAAGKPKSTIATVHGNWKNITPDNAFEFAKMIHNDPQWRQVGMDPERHSYFYDRETQQPVVAADEALHIGPLVYAKNPTYDAPENYKFAFGGAADDEEGITAYHGSPYDFEQFDTKNIGAGEGAQAYGHGLYFAENPDVAKFYRDYVSEEKDIPKYLEFDGERIHQGQELNDLTPRQIAAHVVAENGPITAKKLMAEWSEDPYSGEMWRNALAAYHENPTDFHRLDWKSGGKLYEVHIQGNPRKHFMDWDEPVYQPGVYDIAKEIWNNDPPRALNGRVIWKKLTETMSPEDATKYLQSKGLRGIMYYDASSRHADENRTQNYVVFDHNHVRVRKKSQRGGAV